MFQSPDLIQLMQNYKLSINLPDYLSPTLVNLILINIIRNNIWLKMQNTSYY